MVTTTIFQQVNALQQLIAHVNYLSGWSDDYKYMCYWIDGDQGDVIITGSLVKLSHLYHFLDSLCLPAIITFRSWLIPSDAEILKVDEDTPHIRVHFYE